jgi:hypothetical protein
MSKTYKTIRVIIDMGIPLYILISAIYKNTSEMWMGTIVYFLFLIYLELLRMNNRKQEENE